MSLLDFLSSSFTGCFRCFYDCRFWANEWGGGGGEGTWRLSA